MTSINVSIKKDAYEFLKSLKSENQSFSDVILGFKSIKTPLDFFGVLKEKDWVKAEKNMANLRNSFKRRVQK